MKTTNKIDVHHHIFPEQYVEALKQTGVPNSFGVDFPKWTVDTSLKNMKKNGIQVAMLSITTPGVYINGLDLPEGFSEKTSRMNNEIIADLKSKYPNIRYILSHGGGTIPYIAWRLAAIEYAQNGKRTPLLRTLYDFLVNGEPTRGIRHLKNMYYDTANVSGEYQVKTLQAFAGPDHILFGTDLCIAKLAPIWVKNLAKDGNFSEEEYIKVSHRNCLKLFPNFSKYYN